MLIASLFFIILSNISYVDSSFITTTRFPSTRRFILDERVTVSGVEIHFSNPKLRPVNAIYGLRYASLGGEGYRAGHKPKTEKETSSPSQQRAAKRRFMHSVAAFIYETPTQGHLQKIDLPPECPQPGEEPQSVEDWNHRFDGSTTSARLLSKPSQPITQVEDCLTLNVFVPEKGRRLTLSNSFQSLPIRCSIVFHLPM